MTKKVFIILGILLGLGGVAFFLLRPQPSYQKVLPRRQISFVKAMWLFAILEPELPAMADPNRLRQNGVNTIALDIFG